MRNLHKSLVLVAVLCAITFGSEAANAASDITICANTDFSCGLYGYAGGQGNYTYGPANNGHNCTTYIAWIFWNSLPYTNTDPKFVQLNSLGDAASWAVKAASYGYSVSALPKSSSVAQWNYGHVAYVEAVSLTNGVVSSITVSEDNIYLSDPAVRYSRRRTIYKGSSAWPNNFIDFGIVNGGSGGGKPPVMQIVTPPTATN